LRHRLLPFHHRLVNPRRRNSDRALETPQHRGKAQQVKQRKRPSSPINWQEDELRQEPIIVLPPHQLTRMQNSELTVTRYVLAFVEEELVAINTEREVLNEAFISGGDNWPERDVNHGKFLALAQMRGRLQVMAELQARDQWRP
jgi:hypothetical protein